MFLSFFLSFFYDFLSINLYINLYILFSVSFYNFLLINLHVSFYIFIYVSIYDFLSMLFHHVFEQTHWENLYSLLCAFSLNSFYFSTNALQLRKSLSFTMSFLILFSDEIDFLWKHDYGLNPLLLGKSLSFTMCFPTLFPDKRTGETPIIYYVLSHSIPRFSLKTRMGSISSYWGNPLLLGKPLSFTMCFLIGSGFPAGALSLGKPLLFTMCFPIGSGYWGNLYYLLCASPSYSPAGALGTPLLFTMCFPGGRIAIGEPSIILYVLPHRVLRRAHCHWGNLYYLVGASPVIDVRGLAPTLIVVGAKAIPRDIGETSII